MEQNCVLLDTSFFIRLLNEEDPLHNNALGYFRYFLEHDFVIKISTIAIAEYCVRGEVSELPLKNMLIVPFNFDHAQRAGKMIAEVYAEKKRRGATIAPRAIVPNDTKMFAQADVEPDINFYGTADVECKKVYKMIESAEGKLSFDFIDITIPYTTFFGLLDFKE
uniref:hypothetical protein n=1 Tax=Prevotella sp. TaxID=59823 RepID=UPI004025DB3D